MLIEFVLDLNNNKELMYDDFTREMSGDMLLDNNIICNSSLDLVDDSKELQISDMNQKVKSNNLISLIYFFTRNILI